MTQYIGKADVVAEIERRKEYYENIQMIKPVYESNIEDFNELLSFLDSLEVREVDLEKEYKDFVEEDPVYNKLVNGIVGKAIAKRFFELGMTASNKEQKGE